MTIPQIEIIDQKKFKSRNTEIIQYDLTAPLQPPKNWEGQWDVIFGIDPGNTRMGLTILPLLVNIPINCYEITFPSERNFISRIIQIRLLLNEIVLPKLWGAFDILISVEGSSFGHPYRQTELAEARIVAAEWFMDNFHLKEENFIYIPPLTIRKAVFGSAKIKAEAQWPQLKGDAASSLAIALAGLALKS